MELRSDMSPGASPGWRCPKCGDSNLPGTRFCRRCGSEASPDRNIEFSAKSGSPWKAIIVVVLILSVASIGGVGFYFWHKANEKKVAVQYLTDESQAFSSSVSLINTLSSEKEVEDVEHNSSVYLKTLEDEETKAQKALSGVQEIQKKRELLKSNDLVRSADILLEQYYKEVNETLVTYNQYISYQVKIQRNFDQFTQEIEKLETVFKTVKTEQEAIASLRSLAQAIDGLVVQVQAVTPPAGLEEARDKGAEVVRKFSQAMKDIATAVEKKDAQLMAKADSDLADLMTNQKTFDDIDKLEQHYFKGLHEKFTNLRKEADNIKEELIKTSAGLDTRISSVDIEGW